MGLDPRKNLDRLKEIPTFKDFVNQKYLPFVQVQKRSWEADKTMLENRIIKLWGHKRLTEITRDDIEEFRGNFIRAGFKPATANRYLALVKYIFNLAVKWEVIDKNPTINVQKLKDNNHKERYLTEDETRRLLDELKKCQSNVVPDIIEFLILTGARRSEVVNLPWSELDMENGIWNLPPERNKANTKKIVPLSEGAMDILKRRQNNDSDYVFPNPKTGEPFIFLHGTWDRIRKKAGIPDVRLHDLRHNFASLLINNGRSLYEVQKMLGHSDAKTTERYAHLTQDTLKEATEIVSRSVRGGNITKAK